MWFYLLGAYIICGLLYGFYSSVKIVFEQERRRIQNSFIPYPRRVSKLKLLGRAVILTPPGPIALITRHTPFLRNYLQKRHYKEQITRHFRK